MHTRRLACLFFALVLLAPALVLLASGVVPLVVAAAPALRVEHEPLRLPIAAAWVAADGTVFAGAGESVYRSADGRAWEKVYTYDRSGGLIPTVFVDSRGTVFVNRKGDGRLLRSVDRGATWDSVLTFQSRQCLAWRMA
jgi:hypothetical protein